MAALVVDHGRVFGNKEALRSAALVELRHMPWLLRPDLELVWDKARLMSALRGRTVYPDLGTLRARANRDVWRSVPEWPTDYMVERVVAMFSTHHLAIIKRDVRLLARLYRCWTDAPGVPEESAVAALGQIGLGLGKAGPRPWGWSESEIDQYLEDSTPAGRAWVALARARYDEADAAAQLAAAEARARVAKLESNPDAWLGMYPGVILMVEPKALRALTRSLRSKG